MNKFFKSSSEDSDFKNISPVELQSIFDWLRDIHMQNKRIMNTMKLILGELQSSSPLEEPMVNAQDLD